MCMVALVCIVLIALHSHAICTFKGELTYKMTCLFEVVSACYRDSLPKNGHSVINYLASCHSKPMIILFIFRTQIKIFLMESESFLSLHRQQHNYYYAQKGSKVKTVHVTSVVQP